jgi:integrase
MTTTLPNTEVLTRFKREYQDFHRISEERQRESDSVLVGLVAASGGKSLTTMDASDLQGYMSDLLTGGLHVNTVRKKANMCRTFFSWAFAAGLLPVENYMRLKQVPNPNGSTSLPVPKPYSRAELDAYWSQLDSSLPLLPTKGTGSQLLGRWIRGKTPWKRVARHGMRLQIEAITALALYCGLRLGEIHRLLPDDLHYDNEYIVVKAKRDSSVEKERAVPYAGEGSDAAKLPEGGQHEPDRNRRDHPACLQAGGRAPHHRGPELPAGHQGAALEEDRQGVRPGAVRRP